MEDDEVVGQKGNKMVEDKAIVSAPKRPARVPKGVTPPFVPGGTLRKVREVRRRGCDVERIPSSDEKVSAATAA